MTEVSNSVGVSAMWPTAVARTFSFGILKTSVSEETFNTSADLLKKTDKPLSTITDTVTGEIFTLVQHLEFLGYMSVWVHEQVCAVPLTLKMVLLTLLCFFW